MNNTKQIIINGPECKPKILGITTQYINLTYKSYKNFPYHIVCFSVGDWDRDAIMYHFCFLLSLYFTSMPFECHTNVFFAGVRDTRINILCVPKQKHWPYYIYLQTKRVIIRYTNETLRESKFFGILWNVLLYIRVVWL